MRINGWQRLWLLASILWAVVILALAGILIRPRSDHPERHACSWCGCGSCQSRRFMGSALASLGSAADFKSSQSSPLPKYLRETHHPVTLCETEAGIRAYAAVQRGGIDPLGLGTPD